MGDLADAHKQCLSSKSALEQLLEDFDKGRDRSIATQQRLMMLNKQFKESVSALAPLCNDIRWNKKLTNLRDDSKLFDSILRNQLGELFQGEQEKEDRKNLFGDRGADQDLIDASQKERDMINDSSAMINEMIGSATSSINGIKGNNDRMKGAHRKALDLVNKLRMSNGITNIITSKNRQDQAIVFGCMAFSLFIFFGLYYSLRM